MQTVLLFTADEDLQTQVGTALSTMPPGFSVLPFPPSPDVAGLTASLGDVALVILDRRSQDRAAQVPVPVLELVDAGSGTPGTPVLSLPLRQGDLQTVVSLMLSQQSEGDPLVLATAQKLDAISRFNSGLAHDLNNCFTTILGNLLILPELAPDLKDMLDDINEAADKASNLIRMEQTFYRRDVLPLHPVNLTGLLRDLYDLVDRVTGPRVRLGWLLPDTPCYVHGDEGALEQIILNLVAETCTGRPVVPDQVTLDLSSDETGSAWRLSLSTNGPVDWGGLLQPLPDPVDPTDLGRGIGLHATRQLLDHLAVQVESIADGVCLILSRIEQEVLPDPPRVPVPAGLRVLLAESHPRVRGALAEVLRSNGLEVTCAADVLEVGTLLSSSFDVLVADTELAGGGAAALQALPGLPADRLWMSPGSWPVRDLPAGATILPKPIHAIDLVRAISTIRSS